MTFRVRIAPAAERAIEEFAAYLGSYSEDLAIEQIDRLNRILSVELGESPLTWNYLAFTGAPYRATFSASVAGRISGSSTPSTMKLGRSTS